MPSFAPFAKFRPVADLQTDTSPLPAPGINSVLMPGVRGVEISITVQPLSDEQIADTFNRLAVALKEWDAAIVHLMVFGSNSAGAAAADALRRIFGCINFPLTWVDGSACNRGPIAGLQAFAFAGGEVHPICLNGRVAGTVFEDGAFRHCVLGGLGPDQSSSSSASQTRQTLDQLAKAFALGGFAFGDVMRTWFYLDNLLRWYGEFNRVRTQVYSGVKFRTGSLPASTGIGARNPAASALVAGAWAMQPLIPAARVEEVASPLQCPAPAYGSSFSRAMEIASPAGRRVFISGTASIAPAGQTLWPADTRKQVAQTMQVVEAILHSRGFTFSDLTRAIAYLKHRTGARIFRAWCNEHGLASLPIVMTNCDICRDDLLFELELDAWQSSEPVERTNGDL